MRVRNIMDGSFDDVELYPYQQQTLDRINSHKNSAVLYGRQMGLGTVLAKKALDDVSEGCDVLYVTSKMELARNVVEKLKLNVFDNPEYDVQKNKVLRDGAHINVVTMGSLPKKDDIDSYDTIIIDNAQFLSEAPLAKLMKLLEDFDGTIIAATTATSDFKGTFYNLYANDGTFKSITARRFIHPSFNKEFYQYTVASMGREKYRQQYECRY